tara:strand:- start:7526 stop:7795 length:270 start_codon:yes stop_codon:yes gene_type:complete
MKKIDKDLGKVYTKDNYYYLEKIYEKLGQLIDEEPIIKKRAKSYGFKVVKSSWHMEDNPYYYIQTIVNDSKKGIDELRYVCRLKLKYTK